MIKSEKLLFSLVRGKTGPAWIVFDGEKSIQLPFTITNFQYFIESSQVYYVFFDHQYSYRGKNWVNNKYNIMKCLGRCHYEVPFSFMEKLVELFAVRGPLVHEYEILPRDFEVAFVHISQDEALRTRKIEQIYVRKKGASVLDKTAAITADLWGLTFIVVGTDDRLDPTYHLGHAEIVVEGIKKGRYFIKRYHFRQDPNDGSRGQVLEADSLIFSPGVKITNRTKTEQVEKNKVVRMIEQIKKELKIQDVFFNDSGYIKSLKKIHNCSSWAREKLAIAGFKLEERWLLWIESPHRVANNNDKWVCSKKEEERLPFYFEAIADLPQIS